MDTKENKIKMENEKNNKKNKLVSVIQNILIIIPVIMFLYAITIGVLKFGFKMRGIDGTSMQPTFIGDGKEYTFSNKKIEPKVGDIVIIKTKEYQYIKRVIACPGDVVNVVDGIIYVNDEPSPYQLEKLTKEWAYLNKTGYLVEEGRYYCLGDNINVSLDSKSLGAFERKYIAVVTKSFRLPFKLPLM